MSLFPPRLIDELGDGDARRMLEDAAAETAPRPRVLAAVKRATSGNARRDVVASNGIVGRHRSTVLGVIAGVVLVGAGVGLSVMREEPGGPTLPAPAVPTTVSSAPAQPASAVTVPTASVQDLPSAVIASQPSTARPSDARVHAHSGAPAQKSGDLLMEANRLRAQSLWSEAAARYRLLLDQSPRSAEAYPALVALGDVELVQGRATEALANYERALRSFPDGNLDEEARWGRARSFRALGRTADERAALEDFRARHPDTPLARIAAARLEHLGQ